MVREGALSMENNNLYSKSLRFIVTSIILGLAAVTTASAGGLSDLLETLEKVNKVTKEAKELGETLSGKKHGNQHGQMHRQMHGSHHSHSHKRRIADLDVWGYDSFGYHYKHGFNRFGYNRYGKYNSHHDYRLATF